MTDPLLRARPKITVLPATQEPLGDVTYSAKAAAKKREWAQRKDAVLKAEHDLLVQELESIAWDAERVRADAMGTLSRKRVEISALVERANVGRSFVAAGEARIAQASAQVEAARKALDDAKEALVLAGKRLVATRDEVANVVRQADEAERSLDPFRAVVADVEARYDRDREKLLGAIKKAESKLETFRALNAEWLQGQPEPGHPGPDDEPSTSG